MLHMIYFHLFIFIYYLFFTITGIYFGEFFFVIQIQNECVCNMKWFIV